MTDKKMHVEDTIKWHSIDVLNRKTHQKAQENLTVQEECEQRSCFEAKMIQFFADGLYLRFLA